MKRYDFPYYRSYNDIHSQFNKTGTRYVTYKLERYLSFVPEIANGYTSLACVWSFLLHVNRYSASIQKRLRAGFKFKDFDHLGVYIFG